MDIAIPTSGIMLYALIIGIAAVVYAVMSSKVKRDMKKSLYIMGGIFIVFGLVGGSMMAVQQYQPIQPQAQTYTQYVQQVQQPVAGEQKIISTLKSQFQDKANGSWVSVSGNLDVYNYGDNPADANVNKIGTTTVAAGLGSTGLDNYLFSGKQYGIYFNGGTTFYDMKYPLDTIAGASTTAATTTALIQFPNLMAVGTFADPMVDTLVAGEINGQTNTSGLLETNTNEIMVGADATPALNDRWYYNETNGDGSFYFQYVLSNNVSNKYIKNPVLCFVSDNSAPFASNSVTALSNTHISGSASNIPGDLLTYWTTSSCVAINSGNPLDSSFSSTERMTFTVDESKLTSGDRTYIYIDDLGSHLGKDILTGKKASSHIVLDITDS